MIVSALITLTGSENVAAVSGGFVPGVLTGQVVAGPGVTLLPGWITPLTATLIHGGWLHLGFNLLMLIFCGAAVERALGWRLLVLLYIVGAYAAAAGQVALDWAGNVPTIGASGAISALVAAYALLYAERPVPALGPIPSRAVRIAWLAAGWVGVQALIGFASANSGVSIAIGAHIGGFLAGLALTRPLLLWRYRSA